MELPDHPWIATHLAPLFIWTLPEAPSDEELIDALQARERWAEQWQRPCAWLVDMRGLRAAPATQRKLFGEHIKRFEPHDIAHNQGTALVVPNKWLSGAVTAVFWLAQPKFPNRSFSDYQEGLDWALEQLAAVGESIASPPPAMHDSP